MSALQAVIVGAGLAGLAAADELARAGADVRVLEARDRVGGRVWSVPFAAGDRDDGVTVERGAEFILPGDEAVRALAGRLGLQLVRKGTLYGEREPRGAGPIDTRALARAVDRAATVGRAAAAGSSEQSVAEALASLALPAAIEAAIRARIEVTNAHPIQDLDAAVLAEGGSAFGVFDTHTIADGNDCLARGLAAELGSAVTLHTPVRAIEWSASGVRVLSDDGSLDADAVVVAVPAAPTAQIAFDPPLPDSRRAALRSVRVGQAAKLFVALRKPAPPSATLSVPDRFWCWTQLGAGGSPLPILGAFAGTSAALRALEIDAGPQRWVDALQALRPDLTLDSSASLLSTWHDDPWARGAYSARSLSGPLDSKELAAPIGPLHFAGEHTAGDHHGTMEGALQSGARAARELLRGTARRAGGGRDGPPGLDVQAT
ncbi:MAG: flavin monoamine oxidase family protein [Solirubrobacteraceae bacterium]